MGLKSREPRNKYKDISYGIPDAAKLTLRKNKKIVYSMTLKPVKPDRMSIKINRKAKNPNKIVFGKIENFGNRLEVCAYKNEVKPHPMWRDNPEKAKLEGIPKIYPKTFFLFLNGEHIQMQIDDWRRLYRIFNRVGHYFGILGRKRQK